MIQIEITDQQAALPVETDRLRRAARAILEDHGPDVAELSIAIVDDSTIHVLNRQYLQHDYPTDVLSFVLGQQPGKLEGEVIVGADTAVAQSRQYAVSPANELLLYVIHGVLHLVGFDDKTPALSQQMRGAEQTYLKQFGVETDV